LQLYCTINLNEIDVNRKNKKFLLEDLFYENDE